MPSILVKFYLEPNSLTVITTAADLSFLRLVSYPFYRARSKFRVALPPGRALKINLPYSKSCMKPHDPPPKQYSSGNM